MLALTFATIVLTAPPAVRAQALVGAAQPVVRSKSVEGFGPDAQLVGGLGFGLDGKLNNYFLARGRLGALYATAPWIVNLGLTVEVGALAGLGWGGELELSRGGSAFGIVGVSRVDHARWLMHVGVGYSIFGLEWQHTFEGPNPNNAVLLEVRLPLGLWWLQKRQEKAEAQGASTVHTPQIKQRVGQATIRDLDDERHERSQNGAAEQPDPPATLSQRPRSAHDPSQAAVSEAATRDAEYATRLAEAQAARDQGDRLAEVFALSRAYALRPEPSVALQLAAAELVLEKPRSALATWQRLGDLDQLQPAERERAKQLRQQLTAALSHLRVELSGAVSGELTIWIDGVVEPTATQGYDVPLDPGAHTLQLRRADHVVLERHFQTQAGALLRLSIDVPR